MEELARGSAIHRLATVTDLSVAQFQYSPPLPCSPFPIRVHSCPRICSLPPLGVIFCALKRPRRP